MCLANDLSASILVGGGNGNGEQLFKRLTLVTPWYQLTNGFVTSDSVSCFGLLDGSATASVSVELFLTVIRIPSGALMWLQPWCWTLYSNSDR